MDQETQQRIWDRVLPQGMEGGPLLPEQPWPEWTGEYGEDSVHVEEIHPDQDDSLQAMELCCRENAAVFRQLANSSAGERRELLNHLARRELRSAAALRGMRILNGEEPQSPPPFQAARANPRRALAQCLHRCTQCQQDYRTHAAAGPYAPAFTRLSEDSAETILTLLTLIGGRP